MSNKLNIVGHLEIYKKYKDGKEELIFDEPNVITKGMGVGLSYLFTASGSTSILDYQIDRFQVGLSGSEALQVSSTLSLSSPLSSIEEYGLDSNLFIEQATQVSGSAQIPGQFFALIPASNITKIGKSSVRYTLILDEDACNDLSRDGLPVSLNEIGLFMKNPLGGAQNKSILVAYRSFGEIRKLNDFSLIFKWTINF